MGMLNEFVSKTNHEGVSELPENSGCGVYETIGERETQQDKVTVSWYEPGTFDSLSAQEIGYRLWTSYKKINEDCCKVKGAGSTASTTVYDGKGNLITATIGDSVVFAVVYDLDGNITSVTRLNQTTHHPGEDMPRLIRDGGRVRNGRVYSLAHSLAMSRALGDAEYRPFGVCDDASINYTKIADLKKENTSKIQIITVCDGFTEPSLDQSKEGHEQLLLHALKLILNSAELNEAGLAKLLAVFASINKSQDNISVAVQTLCESNPFLIGVYDGHGESSLAAEYIANNISSVLAQQCALNPEDYARQEHSVHKSFINYHRDNPDNELFLPLAQIEKKLREQELDGIYEKKAIIQAHREKYIDTVVSYSGENNPFLEDLCALEALTFFMTDLCKKYTELELSKKEFMDCIRCVFGASATNLHSLGKYSFLPYQFSSLREQAHRLKGMDDLKSFDDDLLAVNTAMLSDKAAILKRVGLFADLTQTLDRFDEAPADEMGATTGQAPTSGDGNSV